MPLRFDERSRSLSHHALEVPPEVGLIGVAEGGCQPGEGGRMRLRELLGRKTFAELHERIDATIAYPGTIDPELLEAQRGDFIGT